MPDDFEAYLQQNAPQTGTPGGPPALPAAAPAANDPFESFLREQKSQSDAATLQKAQAVAVANSDQSADTAGRAAQVGRQIGAPQAAVETDLPRYEAQAKAQKNAQTLVDNPFLADWVAKNPDSARVAQDDFDGMADIDLLVSNQATDEAGQLVKGLAKGVGSSFTSSALAINRGIGGALSLVDRATGTDASDWWYQHMIAPALANRAALAEPATAPFGVKAADAVGNMLGTLAQIMATGGGAAAAEGTEATTTLGAVGQQVAHGARAMAFPALVSATNTGKDVYDQTGDMAQAIRAAQVSYATTTLGGVVPLGAEGGLLTRAASGFVSGAVTGEVSRQAMNLVMPQQEGFDPVNTILSGLSGAMLSGALGRNPLHDAVRQAYADGLDAETAERSAAKIQQLAELAAASKLRTHDPEAFRNYVASMAEDGPLTNVYVDGKTFADALHQSQIDPNQIPGLNERLQEAVQTGGDVQIPIEDYATHIAGTDLDKAIQPELKAEEGGMTAAEGAQFFQNAKDEMTARAEELVKQQTTGEVDDLQKISGNLLEQMTATGRYPADVAKASLAPVIEFYRTMAERTGTTPGELFERYPLRIGTGSLNAGERLGQDAPSGWGKVETEAPESGPAYNPKGTYTPSTKTISLFQNADLSTFLHESGHFFLDTLAHMAGDENAPQGIRDDMQTFLTWAGGKDLADWNSRSINEQRDMHEKFARGFETYLMEGKAPTQQLQSLFSRFRAWLVNVYKTFTELHGATPSPEMRGVFDRLLASDEAIQQTEAARGYLPLDLSKSGATEKQQSDYAALGEQATQDALTDMQVRSLRDMKWASNAKNKAIKALQREANDARRTVRDEVTKEVSEEPVERARAFLKTGETVDPKTGEQVKAEKGFRLNTDALKSMYPEGALDRPTLENLRGLTAKDGLHPDQVAEIFGFGSGDELVRNLADGEQPADKIDRLVDERMLQRHGELIDPYAIEQAANEAVHNEARARFMATGLKILAKSPIPARELAKAATEAAQTAIAAKRVGDLNPRQYEVAETKANKEAIEQAPKDPAAAVQAQRQALLSNRLAKAARDAMADIKKIVSAQAKYDKASIRAKMDPDILEQIDALRERFDFRQKPPEGPTKQQAQLQQWVDTQKAYGYAPVQHPDMMDPSVRMHYKDMTVEQLRGFSDTIRSMEQIARERKSITLQGKRVQLDEVVGDLVEKMKARGEQFTTQQLVDRPRAGTDPFFKVALDRMASFLRASVAEFKPQQFKANQFDQHEILGPFTRAIFDRVFNANYSKIDMLKALASDFRAGAEELGKDWQNSLSELVPNSKLIDADLTQEHGTTVYRRLTRGDMLGIARHVGNESNFDKLVKGMGWEPGDVWTFLNEHMTPKDWRATQMTWDAFEKHWPDMVEMNRRLGNVSPERIEPRAFRTASGIDLKGGYAPIDYDPIRSKLAVRKSDASAINPSEGLFGRGYFRADTTTNGSLNARVASYYDRLDLDFHSIERRLHDTVHDLAYREALLDAHKILSAPDFRRQFQLTYGPEQYKSLQEWIGDLANGQNSDAQMSRLGQILQSTRHMVVANGIALRISTVIKHGGSAAFKSAGYFSGSGAKYFAARAARMATDNTGQIASAVEKFSEIRARAMQQDRDYKQTTASLFQPESFQSKAERFGHSMVAYMDLLSAVPTAWGAYDRAITEGIPTDRGGTGKPMSEEDAVEYANQVVREAHGSNIESARSMVLQSKSEATKMFTMMYGFMNNSLGQTLDMADKLRTEGFSKPEVLARFLGSIIAPALAAGLVEHHKKDEGWAEWAGKAITGEVAGMVPLVRDAWNAVRGYPSAGLAPLMQTLSYAAKPFKDAWDAAHGKTVKAPIKDLGNAVGLAIPGAGQVGTTLQYAADWKSGKQQPKNVVDVARGLALGQGNQ